jgi:GTP:adenosylcobinamide-phosphate guanylyltransferase
MKTLYLLGFFLLIFISTNSFAQKCDRVYLFGKVVDTMYAQNFYNLMIVNRSTGQGIFGQPDGNFSLYTKDQDSITLSVRGYHMVGFLVEADSNCQMKIMAIIDRKAEQIQEVVIRPLKSLQQIKEERASLYMRETRQVTGIEVLQSPITALYQAFSKKEQSKVWISKMNYKDDQRKVIKELLRLYVSYDVVDLNEEEFNEFISFLNMDETFLKTASEMDLVTFIKDKFEHYLTIYPHLRKDE